MMRHLILFVVPALGYVILVMNIRALAKTKIVLAGVTEMGYALLNFVTIHRVAEATTWMEAVAFASGATTGSLIGLWLTKHWDAK